jgi:hypothetical protein
MKVGTIYDCPAGTPVWLSPNGPKMRLASAAIIIESEGDTVAVGAPPQHVCGLSGYNQGPPDYDAPCPACATIWGK